MCVQKMVLLIVTKITFKETFFLLLLLFISLFVVVKERRKKNCLEMMSEPILIKSPQIQSNILSENW